jgi:hypothetical protein
MMPVMPSYMQERKPMCCEPVRPLSFETLLNDPLTRLVMEADGVTVEQFAATLRAARDASVARVQPLVRRVVAAPRAMSVPA